METTGETRQMEPREVLEGLRDNLYIRSLRHVDASAAQAAERRLVDLTQEVERLGIHDLARGLAGWCEWMMLFNLLRKVQHILALLKTNRMNLNACGLLAAQRGAALLKNVKVLYDDNHMGHLVRNLDGFLEWRADGLEWVFGLLGLSNAASSFDDWRNRVEAWVDLPGWRFDKDFFIYQNSTSTWVLRHERGQWIIISSAAVRLNRSAVTTHRIPEEWPLYSADGLSRFIGANRPSAQVFTTREQVTSVLASNPMRFNFSF